MNDDKRQPLIDTAESETLRMRGNSLHGNRETLEIPLSQDRGRSEKALCHTSDTHVPRESEGPIVPQKQANKAGPQAAAESVEGRGPTKGNAQRTLLAPDAEPGKRGMGLWGVREAAKRDKKMRFTALLHHISPEMLQDSYFELKRSAAPGIDGVTWQQYGQDLEDRIDDLHSRVHRGVYWAQPSKRAWIPKADGRQRPLGIAALEDKIVQQAVKFVLESIYEGDFLGFSYGFRPKRSTHNALDALWMGISHGKVNWVLDADIQGFFDAINHEWPLKFLEHRIADRRILRLIRKWLTAGVSEAGEWSRTTVGTPQGSVISPLLANVFLHYVLDLWAHQWRERTARGSVILVRYADDFVMGFQSQVDAERFLREMRTTLGAVRTTASSRQDAAHRIRPVRGRTTCAAGRGQAGDVQLPGFHAHLREDQARRVHHQAKVDCQAAAIQAARHYRAVEATHASRGKRSWQMAAVGHPRVVQLPRDPRQHLLPWSVSQGRPTPLASHSSEAKSERPKMDLGTLQSFDGTLVPRGQNPASVSQSATDR